ncbi:MAG: PEP-CTERM sorting domain-containing protein, partial [Verrucomicrobiota bacterium]
DGFVGAQLRVDEWTTGPTVDLDDYWGFTVTVDPQLTMDLTSLVFFGQTQSSGPEEWELRYSLDGFAAPLAGGLLATTNQAEFIALSNTGLTGSVEFRLYGFNAGNNTASDHWLLGGMTLRGDISPIPEPGTGVILLVGLMLIGLVRKVTCR